MQTLLPYADFERCAAVLDARRLGKQRVEAPEWYGDVFTDVPPDLPYVWPSKGQ